MVSVFVAVAGAVHHPGEGGFYPGASGCAEEGGGRETLVGDGCGGDFGGVGLVEGYCRGVVVGADAAVGRGRSRGGGGWGCHGWVGLGWVVVVSGFVVLVEGKVSMMHFVAIWELFL